MHDALTASTETSGYLLPEDMYTLLHEVSDELQLMVALTATGHTLDGETQLMDFNRAGLASYLRGVRERIDNALHDCRYPAELVIDDDEQQEDAP